MVLLIIAHMAEAAGVSREVWRDLPPSKVFVVDTSGGIAAAGVHKMGISERAKPSPNPTTA
jgi:hypothetical protein